MDGNVCNNIGRRGENLVCLRLMKFNVFNVYFLGEKAPIMDFLIEIIDKDTPYCCALQVKSTEVRNCYDKEGNMRTKVSEGDLKELIKRPLPTYVVGVDLNEEIIHIAPAFDENVKFNTIPPRLVLSNKDREKDKSNLNKLKADIIRYWNEIGISGHKNFYQSIL